MRVRLPERPGEVPHPARLGQRVADRLQHAALRAELVVDRHSRDARPPRDRVDGEIAALGIGEEVAGGDDDPRARLVRVRFPLL